MLVYSLTKNNMDESSIGYLWLPAICLLITRKFHAKSSSPDMTILRLFSFFACVKFE